MAHSMYLVHSKHDYLWKKWYSTIIGLLKLYLLPVFPKCSGNELVHLPICSSLDHINKNHIKKCIHAKRLLTRQTEQLIGDRLLGLDGEKEDKEEEGLLCTKLHWSTITGLMCCIGFFFFGCAYKAPRRWTEEANKSTVVLKAVRRIEAHVSSKTASVRLLALSQMKNKKQEEQKRKIVASINDPVAKFWTTSINISKAGHIHAAV